MGKKNFERQVLLLKEEGTEGVDASPAAADNSMPYVEPMAPEYEEQRIERTNPMATLSPAKQLVGGKAIKLGFKTAFYGSGALGTAPRCGDLLEMCGFLETVNAGTSVVYTPASENLKTASIYQYISGLLYKSLGSVGNLKISGKRGEPIYFEVATQGIYQDDADGAIVTPQYGSNFNTPPQMLSITFTLDSVSTFILREFNIDMGQSIIARESSAEEHGYAGFMLGKRKPSGNIIIEMESKATYDFLAKWEAATQVAASIVTAASTGNKLTIAMNLSYGVPKIENADGLAVLNIPVYLCKNSDSGGDEITLTCE